MKRYGILRNDRMICSAFVLEARNGLDDYRIGG